MYAIKLSLYDCYNNCRHQLETSQWRVFSYSCNEGDFIGEKKVVLDIEEWNLSCTEIYEEKNHAGKSSFLFI